MRLLFRKVPTAQTNAAKEDGNTALILASSIGWEGIVKLLLDVPGIDVDMAEKNGWTALMLASSKGYEGISSSSTFY